MQIRQATMADVAAIARVHVESWRTTYKDLLPDGYLANLTYEQREPLRREILSKPGGHHLVYVAEDNAGMDVAYGCSTPAHASTPRCGRRIYLERRRLP